MYTLHLHRYLAPSAFVSAPKPKAHAHHNFLHWRTLDWKGRRLGSRRPGLGPGSGRNEICELMREAFPGKDREGRVHQGRDTACAKAGGH